MVTTRIFINEARNIFTLINKMWGLGFKDLQIINHAILEKQNWRIVQRLHYLQGKYFKHGKFLAANIKSITHLMHGKLRVKKTTFQTKIYI